MVDGCQRCIARLLQRAVGLSEVFWFGVIERAGFLLFLAALFSVRMLMWRVIGTWAGLGGDDLCNSH